MDQLVLFRYCDSLLKYKGLPESDIDDKLESSISIFNYLDDKDIFQKFYWHALRSRLIFMQSRSMDLEAAMILRLRKICGHLFTQKFHIMFTDIDKSADLNTKFASFFQNCHTEIGSEFVSKFVGESLLQNSNQKVKSTQVNSFIRVLRENAWPINTSQLTPIILPGQLETTVQMFEIFYRKQFEGRKLIWLHDYR